MARHTIILQTSLRRAFYKWWAQTCPELPHDNAFDHAIYCGLRKPDVVKRELTRHHIGLDLHGAERVTTSLPDDTWRDIHNHRLAYGLPSRCESVRELLRLGLGLPQPKVPRSLGIKPSTVPKMARILQLAEEGLGPTEIGQELGISRQRAHYVLQQARKGRGGIGELAAKRYPNQVWQDSPPC